MTRWSNILVPAGAALAAGWYVGVSFWDGSKQSLLVALSVIAAGVLVRLARGLPFTTPDHYELDEIRRLTAAVGQVVRSLRVLINAVLAGMLGLVVAKPVLDAAQANETILPYITYVEHGISGLLGFILAYVIWRMLQVVKGDQGLTELQSRFVVRAVERKQAKRFEEQISGTTTPTFQTPDGYGRQIQ